VVFPFFPTQEKRDQENLLQQEEKSASLQADFLFWIHQPNPLMIEQDKSTPVISYKKDPQGNLNGNTSTHPPTWEQQGRGLAVFNCPPEFTIQAIEQLPDSLIIPDIMTLPDLTGTEKRIILRLSLANLQRLNGLMNTIVLPAFRRYIPLYLFASFEKDQLNAKPIKIPNRKDVDRVVEAIWPEQLRVLLASMCIIYSNPNAVRNPPPNDFTPLERYLFDALSAANIAFESHAVVGSYQVDGLITTPKGKRLVVEVDGRGVIHERQKSRDTHLMKSFGVSEILRFTMSELIYDRSACINRIQSAIKSGAPLKVSRIPAPEPTLSQEQGACMKPLAGPMLTLAPAGSGKTRVLTRRVVESVRGGILSGRILCVVFNKAASLVMAARIHDEASLPDVHIRTLHSLGYEICRHAPRSPYKGFGVLTDRNLPGGMLALYRQTLKGDFQHQYDKMPRPFPEHLVVAYEEAVSRHRRTLISIDDPTLGKDHSNFDPVQLERVYRSVHHGLSKKQLMTYDDQLYYAVNVLLTVPCARRFYQHRFDAILVDEVQDLTPVQFFLLRLLSMPNNNLFSVGDDDQMINSFTGADPANIRSFQAWYPGAAIRALGENYRCAPDIVHQSAHLISYNKQRFEKPIRPVNNISGGQKAVRILPCPSITAESTALVRTIQQWIKAGYTYADIAVLVRVKSIGGLVQMALKEQAIPFIPLENAAIYTSLTGQIIAAYLEICRYPDAASPAAYAAALSVPTRYLTNVHLRWITEQGRQVLQNKTAFPIYLRNGIEAFETSVQYLHRQYGTTGVSARTYLDEMIDHFGLTEHFIRKDQLSRHPLASTNQDILELIRQTSGEFSDPSQFTDAYLQRQTDEQKATPSASECSENSVSITTIHRSKGDEYRGVILFHTAEHTIPHSRMIGNVEDLEEERRVFYVAVTRAIEQLCILTESGRESRFLAELDQPDPGQRKINRAVREQIMGWHIIKKIRHLWHSH